MYKSLKVWSMLADLEESLGTFQVSCRQPAVGEGRGGTSTMPRTPHEPCPTLQSTKAVYDRILDLRIATPQIVINYAMFLEEHKYFEESFKVRGPSWRSQTALGGCSGCPEGVPQRGADAAEMHHLPVLEIKVRAGLVPLGPLSLACRRPSSCRVLTWSSLYTLLVSLYASRFLIRVPSHAG